MLKQVRQYEVLEPIGSGGLGTVYKARDSRSGMLTALKVIRRVLARNRDYVENFLREASLASSLDNPHVVKVYDYGQDQSIYFIAMEYLPLNLAEILRDEKALPVPEAISIISQVCQALEYAHSRNIIHRDIKPANIMITSERSVKLADFGLARALDWQQLSSRRGIVGTPNYMPPEQALGKGCDVRSDLYSLGCVLYHMVVGRPPFPKGELREVISSHINDPPTIPPKMAAKIPKALQQVILKLLSKDPDRRYQSATDLLEALKSIQAAEAARARERFRTCFIAAPPGVDLTILSTVLKQRGISLLVSSELAPTSASHLGHVTRAISKADLLIAILDPERPNDNVYYELGYARALGKRILILASPQMTSLPSDIAGMLYVHAGADNREVISFALDLALAAPEPAEHEPGKPVDVSSPIGHLADELIDKLESLGDQATGRDVEQIVASALRASGIFVLARSEQRDIGVDFAIWADELDPWVGNPFLLQVKKHLKSQAQVSAVLNQVSTYLQKSNSRWALVLYVKGPRDLESPPVARSSVLFLQVRELLDKLRTSSFGEVVRELRNRRVHRGGF